MTNPKFTTLDTGTPKPMRWDRGVTHHLVGPDDGAEKLDLHVNVINADSGIGPYHLHEHAENVYVVLDGVAEVIIDGTRHLFRKGDVAFIPPGTPHAAGSDGSGVTTVLEVYAPAGRDFVIVEDSDAIIAAARAAYTESPS
jgi:mannose-6-phosphate isomerase-like protein (cupin superfamily)